MYKGRFYIALASLSLLAACHPIDAGTPIKSDENEQIVSIADDAADSVSIIKEHNRKEQGPVYVTAFNTDSNEGDAAALEGVLNVQNGCLYIDDTLIIVRSPYITWQQNPFIMSDSGGGEFRIGDKVVIGGSFYTNNTDLLARQNDWKNPPLKACIENDVWLMNGITTSDEIKKLNKDFIP